jgi:hypothetical protein
MSNCYASAPVALARKELGYIEKASNSNLYSKTGNAGDANYTKYANDLATKWPHFLNGDKNGYDWCTIFYLWLLLTSFGEENTLKLVCAPGKENLCAGCIYAVEYYQNKGRYRAYPSVGDQIFFQDENGDPCHTGIVVDVSNGYVYTIEGNTYGYTGVVANGGCVAAKSYPINSSYIHGYGHPAYDTEPVVVKVKRDSCLYSSDYKDPVGRTTAKFKIPKGTKVKFLHDDGYGWSKVEYSGKKLWTINANLKKSGLSKLHRVKLSTNRKAYILLKGNKLGVIPRKIKKGTTIKVICTITKGEYKNYKLIKVGHKKYYLKSAGK